MSQTHPSLPQISLRSPELMSPEDTALLIVDVQEKLVPHIAQHEAIVWNIARLIEGASALGVKVRATEQYPKGLGPTIPDVSQSLRQAGVTEISEKLTFSCASCDSLLGDLKKQGVFRILVAGLETHVCIQQTVLDTMSSGFRAIVVADAVGSRHPIDHKLALRRLESSGAILTSWEAALFELCETAASPHFKKISEILKRERPVS